MSIAFTTSITIDGQRVELPFTGISATRAWRRANSVFCPLGPAPTQAWFLMTRAALDGLDVNQPHTVTWTHAESDQTSGVTTTSRVLTFPGLYVVASERLLHGGPQDPAALYLVEFADGRYLAARHSDSGVVRTNVRSYANSTDYLTGTEGGTWDSLVSALWVACGSLGSYPGLPPGLPIDSAPQNNILIGLNAYQTLNAILEQLDCAIQPDPFSASTYSIVQLGTTQALTAQTDSLQWDAEPKTTNAAQAAANVAVYFYFHRKSYGQERDTELANNWAYDGEGDIITLATGITGGVGTVPLWDDLPWILDENNLQTNSADTSARASNRKERYAARWSVTNQHRIHAGLLTDFVGGGQVRATLWRDWGDRANKLGGTVTEFKCCAQLIAGLDDDGRFVMQSPGYEREQYAPPDLNRHSFPNYPRLPNIVQVWHSNKQPGESVDPDAFTQSQASLHSGRVKRWVSNTMTTMDPCWILFVDDYDNKSGNVKAFQGDYYGPARLSGVSTCSGTLLPVYAVRQGTLGSTSEYVFFELVNPTQADEPVLQLSGQAQAVICQVNPVTGEYDALADPLTVCDPYQSPGLWQGRTGHRGFAKKRADGKYDVQYMERPALFTKARLAPDSPGADLGKTVSEPATIDLATYYQHGERTPPGPLNTYDPFTDDDDNFLYPRTLTGAKGISTWNPAESRRELLVTQQQCFYGRARLVGTLLPTSTENVSVNNFVVDMFSPFNIQPSNMNPNSVFQVLNRFRKFGEPGDEVLLLWIEAKSDWCIIDVESQQKIVEFLKINPDDTGSAGLYTGDLGFNVFKGRVQLAPAAPLIDNMTNSRPCIIKFIDYPNDQVLVAESGKTYGPGKWIGVEDGGAGNRLPVYACVIGDQEFEGTNSGNVNKGVQAAFTLNHDGTPTTVQLLATVRYNAYVATKKAIIKRLNGIVYANPVEC